MTTALREVAVMPDNPFSPNPNLKVWMGTEIVPMHEARVSVFDHSLLYGDGAFEGIRVYNGRIFKEREHIERLFESCRALHLEIPLSREEVSQAMHATLAANGITKDGYIRLLVTRGVGLLGIAITKAACPQVIVIADKISLYPPEVYERGLRCIISSIHRNHPNALSARVKSLNYLNNVMAKAEAHRAGADEAIMLTAQGTVAECTGDNIFLVRKGRLETPPASEGILEGITRAVVMELARRRGIPVTEKVLIRHDLYVADECFATGTAAEIIPITQIDGLVVGSGSAGPITAQLMADFVEYRTRE
jgi:branched-chain amino acid aminotransferase